jgi:flotillin
MSSSMKNDYLEQVLQNQMQFQDELAAPKKRKARRRASNPPPARGAAMNVEVQQMANAVDFGGGLPFPEANDEVRFHRMDDLSRTTTELDRALGVRITGFWRWKTVVVPPNVYVIHTRRGHLEPIDIGLGISFRFDPTTDAFLLVPATIQTILINAAGICVERQGILVQAYVQWIVDDIHTAYKKLDFSDSEDPMGMVNVQLREQAEAAMKDKISTMKIDEVLADKRSVIEELTLRLREVAEGGKESGGLGLKIVTVQIKEAVVSSTRVWQNLQRPYRADQEKIARIAEIEAQKAVRVKESAENKESEMARLKIEDELAALRHEKEIERYSREQAESRRRYQLEQELEQQKIADQAATEIIRREKDQEMALREISLEIERTQERLKQIEEALKVQQAQAKCDLSEATAQAEKENLVVGAEQDRRAIELANDERERQIKNMVSAERVKLKLVEQLPEIASSLPTPTELRQVQLSSGSGDALANLVSLITGVKTALNGLADSDGTDPDKPKG